MLGLSRSKTWMAEMSFWKYLLTMPVHSPWSALSRMCLRRPSRLSLRNRSAFSLTFWASGWQCISTASRKTWVWTKWRMARHARSVTLPALVTSKILMGEFVRCIWWQSCSTWTSSICIRWRTSHVKWGRVPKLPTADTEQTGMSILKLSLDKPIWSDCRAEIEAKDSNRGSNIVSIEDISSGSFSSSPFQFGWRLGSETRFNDGWSWNPLARLYTSSMDCKSTLRSMRSVWRCCVAVKKAPMLVPVTELLANSNAPTESTRSPFSFWPAVIKKSSNSWAERLV